MAPETMTDPVDPLDAYLTVLRSESPASIVFDAGA